MGAQCCAQGMACLLFQAPDVITDLWLCLLLLDVSIRGVSHFFSGCVVFFHHSFSLVVVLDFLALPCLWKMKCFGQMTVELLVDD